MLPALPSCPPLPPSPSAGSSKTFTSAQAAPNCTRAGEASCQAELYLLRTSTLCLKPGTGASNSWKKSFPACIKLKMETHFCLLLWILKSKQQAKLLLPDGEDLAMIYVTLYGWAVLVSHLLLVTEGPEPPTPTSQNLQKEIQQHLHLIADATLWQYLMFHVSYAMGVLYYPNKTN